jgi:hypothetical protein
MEYENITQKILYLIEFILQNAKQLQQVRLSWHIRCPSFLDMILVFSLLSGAEYYQSLETALTHVG